MAKESEFKISLISDKDKRLISHFISGSWGSSLSVSRGKILDTVNLAGFVCKENDRIIGLVTYHIENNECEIVTLNSVVKNKGLGTKLLNSVLEISFTYTSISSLSK